MHNYIINSFILNPFAQSGNNIYNYISARYDNKITIADINQELYRMRKAGILILCNSGWELTDKGQYILKDTKYYYARRIVEFLRKCLIKNRQPKFVLKEIRDEQQKLRDYLIANNPQTCIICDKYLPLCLLETAHLKPRCIISSESRNDNNLVAFMCRYCHTLYDAGLLGISNNGQLVVSAKLQTDNYDLNYSVGKQIKCFNSYNSDYFQYHFINIFKH